MKYDVAEYTRNFDTLCVLLYNLQNRFYYKYVHTHICTHTSEYTRNRDTLCIPVYIYRTDSIIYMYTYTYIRIHTKS